MPRFLTRENVFVLTDGIRVRQFSSFWTRPHHPTLLYTGALDPMFRGFGNSVMLSSSNFASVSACFNRDASGLPCRGWHAETLLCLMRWMCLL